MKRRNAILALILVGALLCMLFAACGKAENPGQNAGEGTDSSAGHDQPSVPEQTDSDAPAELVTVNFWLLDMNNANGAAHQERLQNLTNEITEPEGIHVELLFLPIGDYISKVQLAIAGKEGIDLICSSIVNNVPTLHNSNMIMDITDLMDEYAPETKELMAEYLAADTYDGRIFGVPVLRNYVTNQYLCFNKQLLDECGLSEQAGQVSSWSELEALFAAAAEHFGQNGIYAFIPTGGSAISSNTYLLHGDSFAGIQAVDTLGDNTGTVYCGSDGKVSLFQASEAYRFSCEKAKQWFDNGWIYPDSIFDATQMATDIMSQGVGLAELCGSEEGVEVTKRATYGTDVLCLKLLSGVIRTSTLTTWGMAVPSCAEEPEAAVRLLNMLYTNEDLMRVLVNGEEQIDYDLVDGQAQPKETMYNMGNYVLGNNLLTLPLLGNGADFYERVEESNQAAQKSPFLGFMLDSSDLSLYISQITAVTDQYKCSMQCGGYTEQSLQEYLDKLNAAGAQEYVEAIQTQLDAWLAAR